MKLTWSERYPQRKYAQPQQPQWNCQTQYHLRNPKWEDWSTLETEKKHGLVENPTTLGRALTQWHHKSQLQLSFVQTTQKQPWLWSNKPKVYTPKSHQSSNMVEILTSSASCLKNIFKNMDWIVLRIAVVLQVRGASCHCSQTIQSSWSKTSRNKMLPLYHCTTNTISKMTSKLQSVCWTHSTLNCAMT